MKRRYQSVGIMSGLGFYDWVARMFPKNLYAVEEDRPKRILPVLVSAEPLAMPANTGTNTNGEVRDDTAPRRAPDRDSRGGQKPFDRKSYMKKYMEDYRQKPVVCPNCGHEFSKLKRKKEAA